MIFSSDSASLKTVAHRLARLSFAGLATALLAAAPAQAIVLVYENATSGAIPTSASNGNCTTNAANYLERTFVVTDAVTPTAVAIGLEIDHNERGDIRANLIHPNGATTQLVMAQDTADDNDDYSILVSGTTDGTGAPASVALNDADLDPLTEPFYHRLVTVAAMDTTFDGLSAAGTWRLRVCDRDAANGVSGTLNRARLVLSNATAVAPVCTSTANYEWGSNGDNVDFVSANFSGVLLTETSTFDRTGDAEADAFRTLTSTFGAEVGYYIIRFDAEAADIEVTEFDASFTLAPAVRDLAWKFLDVDTGAWEDHVRLVALDSVGVRVPYSLTLGTSHQQAGDFIEADAGNIADDSPVGNVTYTFEREVASLSLQYWQGDDNTDPGSQRIGIGNPFLCAFDYGDAPNTYGTQLAGGARHVLLNRELWMGTNRPDGESDGQTGGGVATADDGAAIGGVDDEDGVTLPFPTCPNNGTYSVNVSASDIRTAGTDGVIRGYIDWNRDGDFTDANEISRPITVLRTNADPLTYAITWGAGGGGGGAVPAACGGSTSTFARFRFSSNTAAVASPTGQAADGEVEDYQISAGTLPVTISRVETVPSGSSMLVRFTTASESGNAGFRIWGTSLQGKQVLLATVKSQGSDSFVPQDYTATVRGLGITLIQIEDVSVFGKNRLHGPFAVGSVAGETAAAATIDWAAIRSESGLVSDLDRAVAAESGDDSGGLASFAVQTPSAAGGLLLVRNEGIQRITYEDLRAAGIDLRGINPLRIAVVNNGAGVPRSISTVGGTFGPGGSIEFVARPQLTLASPVDAYVLAVDASKAIGVTDLVPGAGAPGVTSATDLHRPDNRYSYSSPNGDPWFDAQVLAWGASATQSRTFDLPDFADGPVSLRVRVWGWGDFEGAAPDHHVILRLNGTEIAQHAFDGLTSWEPVLDVTDLVTESGNVLEVTVPGDTGYEFDNVAFEGFDATYSRGTVAQGNRFKGTVTAPGAFAIGGFSSGQPVSVWKISGASASRGAQRAMGGAVSAIGGAGEVYAAAQSAYYRPGISAGVPAAKQWSSAEYVIVTHPAFAGSLGNLLALEQSRGLATDVATTDRIFAAYSDHASSAAALKSFLSASIAKGNLRYVLLVGADTTDPYNHLGTGSVSFVPTDYRNFVPYVTYSPTDESLVDRQNDGLGDVPIGRLPVRTPAELDAVVAKLLAWESNIASGTPSALLAAGASDNNRALANLNESYSASLPNWGTSLAQVDDSSSATVRQMVLDAVNGGTDLVSYVGHSSMGQWDFTPILKWQDAATLTNAGMPNLFTAWGCWNSYYVEPTIESLSARLLRQPNAGAAGAIGATTLTSEASHRKLGNLFFARVNAGAARVGDAFHGAKVDLQQQGGAADAIYGMTLLGDPAMSLPPQ